MNIESFTENMTFEDFAKIKTINVVIRGIEVIGEVAKNIPKTIREKYPFIPWKKMVGMRDKMIHEYFWHATHLFLLFFLKEGKILLRSAPYAWGRHIERDDFGEG